ncbi:LysR family transcriptional regulator [Enorma burkinafasonensis]|uniref:LysR substrate-binding domain-containing protein n=1 Tax=Enorma burkinafasonensis TaxID=2590867 RepID=UPI0011AAB507|nr:LysR family transcriptional regulator [Enorma burkinafasonensis]
MNIRQLRYFYLSATLGSLTDAARAENVSVQAVSKSLMELEEELGGKLFERKGRGIVLTPLGDSLVDHARSAVESFDAVSVVAKQFLKTDRAEGDDGYRLALITPPFAKHDLICAALSRLFSRMMRTDVKLDIALGAQAMDALERGDLDAAFTVGNLDDPRCTCLPIGSVSVGMFVGRQHPLRKKRLVTFEDLAPYPVLHNQEIDGFNETILGSCLKRGLASPVVEISTDEEVADFLEQQQGYILGVYLKALDVKPLAFMHKIDPADAPAVPVCMVTLKSKQGPTTERLNHFVCHEFRHLKRLLSE